MEVFWCDVTRFGPTIMRDCISICTSELARTLSLRYFSVLEFLLSFVTVHTTLVNAVMALISFDFPSLISVDLRLVPGCPLVPFFETPGDAR